mgnify:CR=1 FL=1
MIRATAIRPPRWFGIPRESGDDPAGLEVHRFVQMYSPRERG